MRAEVVVETGLVEVEPKTLGNVLGDQDAKALVHTGSDASREKESDT